jgi:hypothetical protein
MLFLRTAFCVVTGLSPRMHAYNHTTARERWQKAK